MALSKIELKRCQKDIEAFLAARRPAAHIRSDLDVDCRIEGQNVEVVEIRPAYRDPSIKQKTPIARATFVRTFGRWRVFWMRQDLCWHSCLPKAEVNTLKEFLNVVDRDEHSCFWG